MAVYPAEFEHNSKEKVSHFKEDEKTFTVLLHSKTKAEEISPVYIALAAKPLIYVSSVCGLQLFQYNKDHIQKLNNYRRLYSAFIISLVIILVINIKPASWNDTKVDVPLNILTISFGYLHNLEIICSIFQTSFWNSALNEYFFTILDNIDRHLRISKDSFHRVRWLSIVLVLIPLLEFSCTFILRRFVISNLPVHLTFFMLSVNGAIIVFLITNLYMKQIMLNSILKQKCALTTEEPEEERSSENKSPAIAKIMSFLKIKTNDKAKDTTHYCWLELMQIYDKISDCYFLFDGMYALQVLFMFLTWLMVTLLIICRSLSPSLKYSELFLSDLFLYTCINSRPFFLAIMCELIVRARSETLDKLLKVLVHKDLDQAYYNQVQTMVNLVETRKLEISANIFPVNIPTVAHFAGRAISYVVLMIQYFYKHLFEIK